MEEYDRPTGIKVEHGILDGGDVLDQKPDMINVDTLCEIAGKPIWCNLKVKKNIYTERPIKDEPCDSNAFQPVVTKNEDDDEFLDYESKCTKEEQYMALEEDTSNSKSTENNHIGGDVTGPSPPYEIKCEEVDLGVTKMENDEDPTSDSMEDRESGEQQAAPRTTKMYGGKMETFNCIKCEKVFASKRNLHGHILARHSDNAEMMKTVACKIHRCMYCKYMTVHILQLARHMDTHKKKLSTTFDCMKCGKEFSSKYCLDGHIAALHGYNCETFCCIECEKEFSSKHSLDGHIVARHSNKDAMMNSVTSKIHGCKHCKFVTVDANKLTKHMRRHGRNVEMTFECAKCEKVFLSKLKLDGHIVALHGDNCEMMNSVTYNIHCCKHCSYITVDAKCLSEHIRTHGEQLDITFDCVKCGEKCYNKHCLDSHILTMHSNDPEMMNSITNEIHRCKLCKYVTVIKTQLHVHMRTHMNKPAELFHCTECEKEFSSRYCLDGHIVAQHSNDGKMMKSVTRKIHRCKHCNYITINANRLTEHMRNHEKNVEMSFNCVKCKKGFQSKLSFDGHVVAQHSDDGEMMKSVTRKIHRCKQCKYMTIYEKRLPKHMSTHEIERENV